MTTRIEIPDEAREIAGLTSVDYADAFAVDVTEQRSPAEWISGAAASSPALFRAVRVAHRLLGLHLAPAGSAEHPIGWDLLVDEPTRAVLGNHGRLGTGRIVGLTPPGQVVLVTLLELNGVRGRALWTAAVPVHRAVARYALDRLSARPERVAVR